MITTTVQNARGIFLLGCTTGTLNTGIVKIGEAEYQFDDGTTVTAEINFPNHYILFGEDATSPTPLPAYPAQSGAVYYDSDGSLVECGVTAIFHPFPQTGNITKVTIRNTEDILADGSIDDAYDAPVWLFGMTAVVTPE